LVIGARRANHKKKKSFCGAAREGKSPENRKDQKADLNSGVRFLMLRVKGLITSLLGGHNTKKRKKPQLLGVRRDGKQIRNQ